jgi:hypothetical protein
VKAIERSGSSWLVTTSKGEIRAEIVVNAAGQWAKQVGRMVGVDLPIVPLEHHYLVTEKLDALSSLEVELPVLRDADASFYIREEGGALLVGAFERNTKPWALQGIPEDFHSRLLQPDLGRLEEVLEAAARRVPAFENAGIKSIVNGPDGYTPDGLCLMGPIPGLRNFHVLAGFSIFGIVFGGGAGKYAAEWIVEGQPSDNMWELDARRFDGYASSTKYVVARACEVYGREYAIHYPEEELPAGRLLKTGPLYDRLLAKGAVFGARFAWERPLWFSPGGPARDEYSFHRGNWHTAVGEECCRSIVRRRARPDELCEVRSLGAGRREIPRPPLREHTSWLDRPNVADTDVHAAGRHRVRRHRDQARGGSLLRGVRGRDRVPRLRVDRAPPAR